MNKENISFLLYMRGREGVLTLGVGFGFYFTPWIRLDSLGEVFWSFH